LFSVGSYQDQCLQLGEGSKAELQEETFSYQTAAWCECKSVSGIDKRLYGKFLLTDQTYVFIASGSLFFF